MFKRLTACILCAAAVFCLCGCVSIENMFEKEYESVSDYQIPEYSVPDNDRVTVRSFTQLKLAILQLVTKQLESGTIVFDTAYDGDVSEDIASACWQLRTQNALCAYCVENISYELTRIVTYSEADMSVTYSKEPEVLDEIVEMSYAIGLDEILREALEENDRRLVLYIQTSGYTAEEVESMVTQAYHNDPLSCINAPNVSVHMFSGTNRQRLYEINIAYGMSEEKLQECKTKLNEAYAQFIRQMQPGNTASRLLRLCEYLTENCGYSEDGGNTAYSALVDCEADDEGLAHAYAGLCKRMGIECYVVYGQRDWTEHCWNIVKIDGDYYHVDVSTCYTDMEHGFLRTDESMWSEYRWDTSAYEACSGSLTYYDAAG